jgi:Protein of unknown function (DUF1572)
MIQKSYIENVKLQFLYYKTIAEKAMEQLDEDQLFISVNEDSNSIATIVKHLSGNMISRWTDFKTTDGEKPTRNRDSEFENNFKNRQQLLESWNKGWKCFFDALQSIESNQLEEIIYIRNEGHTILEAINRQLAHYPYHVGQIVFFAKMLKKVSWTSLSIPKNKSNNYNEEKFSKKKAIRNFTDNELKKLK